jgi:hypothetical protein
MICPLCRDHGLTAIRQDQDEVQAAVTMNPAENIEQSSLKRMVRADNRDLLGKVLMMGSVS